MNRSEYEDTPGKLEYWLDCQTAGACTTIKDVLEVYKLYAPEINPVATEGTVGKVGGLNERD
jgi:hypothetical protein